MKANHQVNVVRLSEPRVHPNADTLELFDIGGYQVVTKKGQFKSGDLAVYIQPDSVVPQTEPFKFIWGDHVGLDGTVPERRRRITVKRLRQEYSEGLLISMSDVPLTRMGLGEGDDVSELMGITHYDPDASTESTKADTAAAPRRRYPRRLKGWFFYLLHRLGFKIGGKSYAQDVAFNFPTYDVDAYKNFKKALQEGEQVHISEKIHGSNARYVFVEGEFYAGSRTQWKKKGDNVWWKAAVQHPEIEQWCRAHEGWVLYGEVTPTQKNFNYGNKDGEVGFHAFDVYGIKQTPISKMGTFTDIHFWGWASDYGFSLCAPVLYTGPFNEELLKLADGDTLVPGAKHIREGIVIRTVPERSIRTLGRVQLKVVSNRFLEKDNK